MQEYVKLRDRQGLLIVSILKSYGASAMHKASHSLRCNESRATAGCKETKYSESVSTSTGKFVFK